MYELPEEPGDLGFHSISHFRSGQREAILSIMGSTRKLVILTAPPGSGKSLIAMVVASILSGNSTRSSGRAAIATKTLQLQQQYADEFADKLVTMWGRGNFACLYGHPSAADAPCVDGWKCPLKAQSPYFVQQDRARASPIVAVNYDYLAAGWSSRFLPKSALHGVDYLIGDEAHLADESLRSASRVEVSDWVQAYILDQDGIESPRGVDMMEWMVYAYAVQETYAIWGDKLAVWAEDEDQAVYQTYRKQIAVYRKFQELTEMLEGAGQVAIRQEPRMVSFEPVFARQQFQKLLRGLKKVVLMSATMPGPELTARLLGVAPTDYEVIDLPSTFPAENRPFIYDGVTGITKSKMQDEDFQALADAVVSYLDRYEGMKGIIHTGAYWLQNEIMARMPYRRGGWQVVTHGPRGLTGALEVFEKGGPGTFLMSPVAHSGVNLPDDHIRLQLILKLPFSDLGSPIIAARREVEPDTYDQATAATVIQSYGRGVRHDKDFCVTVMLDKNWGWWYPRNLRFFPTYFQEAVVTA